MVLAVVVTSCYFFPFILSAFPIANSKMILAVIGLVLLGISLTKKENAGIDRDFITLSLWALAISLIAFISITIIILLTILSPPISYLCGYGSEAPTLLCFL